MNRNFVLAILVLVLALAAGYELAGELERTSGSHAHRHAAVRFCRWFAGELAVRMAGRLSF
jgi:hypothetical protein